MPTYEYQCGSCKREFEIYQSIKDDALSECEECGGGLRRLIGTGAAVIMKGSGFNTNRRASSRSSCDRSASCSTCRTPCGK